MFKRSRHKKQCYLVCVDCDVSVISGSLFQVVSGPDLYSELFSCLLASHWLRMLRIRYYTPHILFSKLLVSLILGVSLGGSG